MTSARAFYADAAHGLGLVSDIKNFGASHEQQRVSFMNRDGAFGNHVRTSGAIRRSAQDMASPEVMQTKSQLAAGASRGRGPLGAGRSASGTRP